MRRTIREMTEQLMGLGDEAWGHYAFFHEPLERKLSKEQKASYTKLAMKCGREEGVLLKTANPQKTVLEITRDMGIRVETPDIPNGGGHVTFAQYEETGKIIIFMDCIKKADDLIRSEGMVLMYCYSKEAAEALYEEIMEAASQKEENDADNKREDRK